MSKIKKEHRGITIEITEFQYGYEWVCKKMDGSTIAWSDDNEGDSLEEAIENAKNAIDKFFDS